MEQNSNGFSPLHYIKEGDSDWAVACQHIQAANPAPLSPAWFAGREIYADTALETWAVRYAFTNWPTGMRLMPDIIRHTISWKQVAKLLMQGYNSCPWPLGLLIWRNDMPLGTRIINL